MFANTCNSDNPNMIALGPLVTEQVPCNICGCPKSQRLFSVTYRLGESTADLGIVRCWQCGLVYVSPRLTFESTQDVYRQDGQQTISHNYCWDGNRDGDRFQPLLGRLANLVPRGQLLDVGCGSGQFLSEARRFGKWDLFGVEPMQEAAKQAAQDAGCTVHAATLDELKLPSGSFDVVTMLGVLEHLHNPRDTLERVRSLLKPSGILAVYVPNFNYLRFKDAGLLCYLRRGQWSSLHPQEHQYQFTKWTLKLMLEAGGFEQLRVDIGRPFKQGGLIKRGLKKLAFVGVCGLRVMTGIHLGGLEVIARSSNKTGCRIAA